MGSIHVIYTHPPPATEGNALRALPFLYLKYLFLNDPTSSCFRLLPHPPSPSISCIYLLFIASFCASQTRFLAWYRSALSVLCLFVCPLFLFFAFHFVYRRNYLSFVSSATVTFAPSSHSVAIACGQRHDSLAYRIPEQ